MKYRYRIEIRANVPMTAFGRDRRMTAAELEAFRRDLNASFLPGGVNEPRQGAAIVPHVSRCTMVDQRTRAVVAVAAAPLFEVA